MIGAPEQILIPNKVFVSVACERSDERPSEHNRNKTRNWISLSNAASSYNMSKGGSINNEVKDCSSNAFHDEAYPLSIEIELQRDVLQKRPLHFVQSFAYVEFKGNRSIGAIVSMHVMEQFICH